MGLETRLTNRGRTTWDQPDADRLAARLCNYGKRLTTCHYEQIVDGTNNAAERAVASAGSDALDHWRQRTLRKKRSVHHQASKSRKASLLEITPIDTADGGCVLILILCRP